MRLLLIVVSLSVFLADCNDGNSADQQPVNNDTVIAEKPAASDTNKVTPKDTVVNSAAKIDLTAQIPGFWAAAGEQNASFVIEKNKIFYPDQSKSYKYSLVKDSMKIKYDDYTGSFSVKMKGADTLILTGDEEQIYYRFKKK